MPNKKPQRLSNIIPALAAEGANDHKWVLAEHQLAQAKMSVQIAKQTLYEISVLPENGREREIAEDCASIVRGLELDILEHYTTFLSYLSGTDVSERMSRKEL